MEVSLAENTPEGHLRQRTLTAIVATSRGRGLRATPAAAMIEAQMAMELA
ncbi:MAG: hypothetical protein WA414_07790 [Acidobacteriaceae bacterium]